MKNSIIGLNSKEISVIVGGVCECAAPEVEQIDEEAKSFGKKVGELVTQIIAVGVVLVLTAYVTGLCNRCFGNPIKLLSPRK